MVLATLCEAGLIEEADLLRDVANELGLTQVDLAGLMKTPAIKSIKHPSLVDGTFFLRHRCFPMQELNDRMNIAFADPLDTESISQLEFLLQRPIRVLLAAESVIVEALGRVFTGVESEMPGEDLEEDMEVTGDLVVPDGADANAAEAGSKAAPVVKLVNKILLDAISAGVSDIHLEPTEQGLDVRFRVDGVMHLHQSLPKRLQLFVATRVKLLSGMNITERRRPQDGRFTVRPGKAVQRDIRASTVPTPFGEKVVLRVLRADFEGLDFSKLGFPNNVRDELQDALSGTDRIVVVTGPTGSGKTTTLYTALMHLRKGLTNIITIEDPIEFRIDGLTQIQIDSKIGMTFASGMRSVLRQDPDVIFVGEVRDLETAQTAFQAAQTGHLVLTSLHTNNAPSAITRLRDLGVEPHVISSGLSAVLAQRLVRKLCSHCATISPSHEQDDFRKRFQCDSSALKSAVGCAACESIGFKGRIGLYSLLKITPKVRELIRSGAAEDELAQAGSSEGLEDLNEAALALVQDGVTTLDEVERVLGLFSEGPKRRVNRRQKSAGDVPVQQSKRRVLLVDDDPAVRMIVSRGLQNAAFDVIEATDAEDALEKIPLSQPHIVLCDLDMPGVSGRELLTSIRNRFSDAELPVVILTHLADEATEIELLDLGADDYVSKSSSMSLLTARLRRVLRLQGISSGQ